MSKGFCCNVLGDLQELILLSRNFLDGSPAGQNGLSDDFFEAIHHIIVKRDALLQEIDRLDPELLRQEADTRAKLQELLSLETQVQEKMRTQQLRIEHQLNQLNRTRQKISQYFVNNSSQISLDEAYPSF
jgi:hypothetical protein